MRRRRLTSLFGVVEVRAPPPAAAAWRRAGPSRRRRRSCLTAARRSMSAFSPRWVRGCHTAAQSGQAARSLVSTATIQPGSACSTARTFRFGAGAQDANVFTPLDAGYRNTLQVEPACTEVEADPKSAIRRNLPPSPRLLGWRPAFAAMQARGGNFESTD